MKTNGIPLNPTESNEVPRNPLKFREIRNPMKSRKIL